MAQAVSVDLPDPWDPLAWPEPLESLDVRYKVPPEQVESQGVAIPLVTLPNKL